jgi:O-antigen ligase
MNRWNAFRALVFLLPLPFGLDTGWAWSFAGMTVFALLALELRSLSMSQRFNQLPYLPLPVAFRHAALPLALIWGVQIWCVVQWLVFSLSPHDSLVSLQKGVTYAGFFTLCLLIIDTRQRVKEIIWIVVLAAAAQAIYGSTMTLSGVEYGFFQPKDKYQGVATGTFLNRNHLAGFMELSLALGIGLLLGQPASYSGSLRQRARQVVKMLLSTKVILRLLLAVLVIALVLSRSRMGNSAFFASLLIAGGLALLLMRNKTTATTVLLSSLLIIDIAIVGAFFGVDKVAERLQKTTTDTESRDEVTRDTINLWKEYPVAGIGAGTFIYVFPSEKSDDINSTQYYNNAHNDYAQFLAEFGLPAFLALGLLVLWAFWSGVAAMRQRNSSFYQGVGFAVTMAIVAIGIHSTVDFNLQIPANAMVFVLILALAAIARWSPHQNRTHSFRR